MFQITKNEHDDVIEISMRGILDMDGARDLKFFLEEILLEKKTKFILNFRRVEKINYSNLPMIAAPIQNLMTTGTVVLSGVSDAVAKVLKTTPYYQRLKSYANKDEALEALADI